MKSGKESLHIVEILHQSNGKVINLDTSKFPNDVDPFVLITDGEMLHKTVSKLIDNSVKFTKEGSFTLGFELFNKKVEIFVKDTDKFFEKETQDLMFKPFMQEDVSNSRCHEGNVLGLSIAKV